ncbi:MAG: hypothetical protein ACRDJ5_04845, partial [Actinomycetota bacterium]
LGVLVYSVTLVSVVQATRDAKAKVEAGSDVAADISREGRRPPDLAVPSTSVLRTEVELFPGGEAADLLAVDPQDFEEVAFWDESFSDVPLEELLGRLEQKGPRLPAIVAGADLPERASIERIDAQVPLEIVAKVRAWPGMAVNKPLLVGDATRVARAVETRRSDLFDPFTSEELWARGEAPQVLNQLRDQGVVIESTRSAEEIRRRPELVSLSWTFGFMQAFGILVGSIALLGLVLYVQSRQQARLVSYALAARMGLSRSSHATAVALELAGMLGLSFLVGGALALIAARLAATRLDPMPQLPPGPVFSIPVLLIAAIPLVLIATSLLGAWLVQRAAERANVSDVMRLAV